MSLFGSGGVTPSLTEQNLPDQAGKVFVITGATSGVGRELLQILYQHNAKVYVAARSSQKAKDTITALQQKYPQSKGQAVFLQLDLDDLTSVSASANQLIAQESRLDVLWNNAGVMIPPQGSSTKQGYELQLGTNCLGPFLFTTLMTPLLRRTSQLPSAVPGSVRVVWVSSSAAERFSPPDGVDMSNLNYSTDQSAWHKYGVSKAGNILYAKEYALRNHDVGVVSVAIDPGNLKTDLYKHVPRWQKPVVNLVLKKPIFGAYTELYAGLSPEITVESTGAWIEPWGHIKPHNRQDIELAGRRRTDGGKSVAERFWHWSDEQVDLYR